MANMLHRWDPFRDLMSIQNELDRLFGRTYLGTEAGSGSTGSWVPMREEAKPRNITVKAS